MVRKWMFMSFLTQSFWMIVAVIDMEASMTSSWLERDWSPHILNKDTIKEGDESGCICRIIPHFSVDCYGSTTCIVFPKTMKIDTEITDLEIRTTAISVLETNDLDIFTKLEIINIDANYQLTQIEPGIFQHLPSVKNLSISFNIRLKQIHEKTFIGLKNLKVLKLVKNGFQKLFDVLPALTPHYLPSLETLSLSENYFQIINERDFDALDGTLVSELNLILCQIELIHPQALRPFSHLTRLRLGGNPLSEDALQNLFEQLASENIPISLLNLYELGLRKGHSLTILLEKISQLNVSHLILSRNHIETIYNGLFPVMENLQVLDLREISVLDIENGALDQKILPQLETLLLGGNKLPGVISGVLLPQLKELDLSDNSGSDKFPSYFDVTSGNAFENMTRLSNLNLSFNRIVSVSNTTFKGLLHLEILGLKNSTIYYIAPNSFLTLHKLKLLNLENNPFSPFNRFEQNIFQGLESLENLLLGGCAISHFKNEHIFDNLINLKYISLADNFLKQINPNIFLPLKSLIGLDLTHSNVIPWRSPNRWFRNSPNLEVLLLSRNKFTYISQAMMNDFSKLSKLDLSRNPFICECSSFRSVKLWLRSKNMSVFETNIVGSNNLCVSPDGWRDRNIIEFIETEASISCPDEPKSILVLLIPLSVTALILSFFVLVAYRFRWHIRYWSFLIRMELVRRRVNMRRPSRRKSNVEFKYDAFVSYSHEDRNFIVRLVSMLENYEPFLKLCVYERDFQIGTIISETVIQSVAASRRTLLIVSDAFARSQWCMWELQLAEHHSIFFNKGFDELSNDDSFIMIKLGPIANSHMTPTLRYLLKTRIYLEWDSDPEKQRVFWNKLRKTLGDPKKNYF